MINKHPSQDSNPSPLTPDAVLFSFHHNMAKHGSGLFSHIHVFKTN